MRKLWQERILSCLRLICSLLGKKWIQRSCKRSSQNLEKSTELELVAPMILGFVCTSLFKFVSVHKVTLVGPSSAERVKDANNLVHLRTPTFVLHFGREQRRAWQSSDSWPLARDHGRRNETGTCFPLPAVLCAQIYSWERGLETGKLVHGL